MDTVTLIAAIFVSALVAATIGIGWLPARYRKRACAGREWRRAFPNVPKGQIREFLSAFVVSFGLAEKDRLKFSPADRIFDIYRAIYPIEGWPDALELESLEQQLKERHGLDLKAMWSPELTLGQVFSAAVFGSPARRAING